MKDEEYAHIGNPHVFMGQGDQARLQDLNFFAPGIARIIRAPQGIQDIQPLTVEMSQKHVMPRIGQRPAP